MRLIIGVLVLFCISIPGKAVAVVDASQYSIVFADFGPDVIYKADLDGSNLTAIASAMTNPIDVVYDPAQNYIYWAENVATRIRRARPDGSEATTIIDQAAFPQISSIEHLALDTVNGKIYWTDDVDTDLIARSNLDGSDPEVILSGSSNVGNPYGIDLDVANGYMYWADSSGGRVRRAGLDGSKPAVISFGGAYDLSLDLDSGHIFVADYFGNRVFRINTDGTGFLPISLNAEQARGVHYSPELGKVFWTSDGATNTLSSANPDGSDPQVLLSGLSRPAGLTIIPEPASAVLLGTACLLLGRRRSAG